MMKRPIVKGDKMTRVRFKRPPITEAIVGVSIIQLPPELVAMFDAGKTRLSDLGYTQSAPISQHQIQFKLENGKLSSSPDSDELLGTRFISASGKHVAQFSRTGFIFNQIGEYSTWEEFTSEAKSLWQAYLEICGTVEAESFQVRYINKLFLPNGVPTENNVRVYPFLPPDLPQDIIDSFMRIKLPIAQPLGSLTHQQILLPPEREGFQTLLFDNDFRFSALQIPLGKLWEHIEKVRDIKDKYFVDFLTDNMKESFNA